MRARLECAIGRFAGVRLEILREAVVGREGCDLDLRDVSVSARHARIYFEPRSSLWMLEDLGSTNGTTLDGIAVEAPEPLGVLDIINFAGICDFVFHAIEDDEALGPASLPPDPPMARGDEGMTMPGFDPVRPRARTDGPGEKTIYDPNGA